ncbi:MAG: response regulator transcription factor [Collinsella sp.]|nr:response regulator transcription factor [Collinsella sp.]
MGASRPDDATTVLIAEDDADIVEILRLYLTGAGYRVLSAPDGLAALDIMRSESVSIALVDLMMPHMNGYDFIREVRRFSTCPVIIVSARSMAADKVLGLDVGADGYITKPFDPMEVTAYIRAMLRRVGAAPEASRALAAGDLELDTERLMFTRAGERIPLTAAELKIMAQFLSAPGRVFSKEQLYASICGTDADQAMACEASVMVHISNIRSKIEEDPSHPRYIRTVRGLGYRLEV